MVGPQKEVPIINSYPLYPAGIYLIALTFLLIPGIAAADWFADLEAGIRYNDNLPRAQLSNDRKSDTAFLVEGVGGKRFYPTEAGILSLSMILRAQGFARFDDINSLASGGRASYRHKLGLGASAPWISLAVGGGREDFQGNLRNAAFFDPAFETGIRFRERWDLRAGLRHERRYGAKSDVFDQTGTTVSLNAGYEVNEWLFLSLGGEFRNGDVVSSSPSNPRVVGAASARVTDPAFGSDVVAYRLEAKTYTLIVASNVAVTDRFSLDLSYERQETQANKGIHYLNNVTRFRVLYSF